MLKLILILLLSSSAFADEWSREDTQREAVYLRAHIIDWAQTSNIAAHPDMWHETNSILGKHPTPIKVDRYFLVMGIAHVAVSNLLPIGLRAPFQNISIVLENGFVSHNLSIGISAGF